MFEITAAVRSNVWWLGLSILGERRFALYLWASVALAVLFVMDGALALRKHETDLGFVALKGPLTIVVVGVFVVIAHGWRIRTDVAPPDAISRLSDLPIAIRILADPWLTAAFITSVALLAVLTAASGLRQR